jgi:4-amino-4-deoxy-L-arabinose transferase-like glycosyltransferase
MVREKLFYQFIVIFAIIFSVIHLISLPLFVFYDSLNYYKLSKIILHPDLWMKEWYFLRTPLYPISLLISFKILGENSLSIIFLNSLLCLTGIILLSKIIKQELSSYFAGISILILLFFPLLIAYEHTMLMESGLFFFLSLFTFLLLIQFKSKWIVFKIISLIISITIGFYWKPNLLYLIFPVSIIYIYNNILDKGIKNLFNIKSILSVVCILLFPILLAYPWNRLEIVKNSNRGFILAGSLMQAIIQHDHFLVNNFKDDYLEAINSKKLENDNLPPAGIIATKKFYVMLGKLFENAGSNSSKYFIEVILANPYGYLKAIKNNITIALLYPHEGDETIPVVNAVSVLQDTIFTAEPSSEYDKPAFINLRNHTGISIIHRIIPKLMAFYYYLVRFSWLNIIFLLIYSLFKKDKLSFTISFLSISYSLMHILPLISSARYLFPAMCLNLVGLVMTLNISIRIIRRFKTK